MDPQNTLDLILGRPRLLVLKDTPKRVQIAGEEREAVATSTVVTPRELSLLGKRLGTTVLNLWFTDPRDPNKQIILSYLVRVLPDPEIQARLTRAYKELAEQINHAFPDSVVHLMLVGNNLVVSGEAKDIVEATQILRIVQSNAPLALQAANVPLGPSALPAAPETALPGTGPLPGVIPPAAEQPGIIPPAGGLPESGVVSTTVTQTGLTGTTAQTVQQPLGARQAGYGINVVNLLRVPGEQQVMLKVVVAEVNRSAARSIGINFSIRNEAGVTVFNNTTGNIAGTTTGGTGTASGIVNAAGSAANLTALLDGGQVALAIDALRTLDFARTLAEPNLTTLNGKTARFLAGGEFPVPVVTGFTAAGLQGVSFVPFGVQLSFTPFITDKDRIRLNVAADVSTRDPASAATVGGTTVPGLNTRNFQTSVELRDGQTLAVAGLIQNNFGADATRVPLFGDLPVVGRFFAFDRTSAAEQELIVLVTPGLVHPLDAKETPALPGSDVYEPGDVEFYLLGRLESRRTVDYRSPVRTDIRRMCRYHRCADLYIIGQPGHADGN